jgi:hypothetical protein
VSSTSAPRMFSPEQKLGFAARAMAWEISPPCHAASPAPGAPCCTCSDTPLPPPPRPAIVPQDATVPAPALVEVAVAPTDAALPADCAAAADPLATAGASAVVTEDPIASAPHPVPATFPSSLSCKQPSRFPFSPLSLSAKLIPARTPTVGVPGHVVAIHRKFIVKVPTHRASSQQEGQIPLLPVPATVFGAPLLLPLRASTTGRELYAAVWDRASILGPSFV